MESGKTYRWKVAMANLMARRAGKDIHPQPVIDDYARHMKVAFNSGFIGFDDSVMDVGCGDCKLRDIMSKLGWRGTYIGLDPYPIAPLVINVKVEDCAIGEVDCIVCFAVLDGTDDLDKALKNINSMAKKSIIILAGLDIVPDKCHTYEITHKILRDGLPDFSLKLDDVLHPKVSLLCYKRKK